MYLLCNSLRWEIPQNFLDYIRKFHNLLFSGISISITSRARLKGKGHNFLKIWIFKRVGQKSLCQWICCDFWFQEQVCRSIWFLSAHIFLTKYTQRIMFNFSHSCYFILCNYILGKRVAFLSDLLSHNQQANLLQLWNQRCVGKAVPEPQQQAWASHGWQEDRTAWDWWSWLKYFASNIDINLM